MLAQWHEGVGSWLGVVKSVLLKECTEVGVRKITLDTSKEEV
jgi:hypothetical protein